MRIVINSQLATRNRQWANYLFLLTFLLLIGGFIFVNIGLFTGQEPTGELVILQALVLPFALVMTLVSIRMTNLWARPPRPEQVIEANLKGLNKRSVLYHYHHIPTRHLLICPQGVFAITTRWHDGTFSVKGDQWRSKANVLSRFFSTLRMDGIGNPTREAKQAAQHAQALLSPHAPDVVVQPLILMLSNRVKVVEEEPSDVPILFADDTLGKTLQAYLRELNAKAPVEAVKKVKMPLSEEQLAAFEAATIKA